ncbi:MAG TPA: tetratricopeptide repeat protein [Polyangiaceae bacterium]
MKVRRTSQDLFERALALHRAGRASEAEPLYRQVISRNREHHRALFGLSVILFEALRFDEAARYLERAVDLEPTQLKYVTNLGEIYRRQGKRELAARTFEKILVTAPDFAEARQNLAVTLIGAGAHAEALPHLERVAELRPDQPMPHVIQAFVLGRLRRPAESAARARRAIELAPDLAAAHRHLGTALEELGDKSGAVASFRRAVELDPADHDAHSTLIVSMLTDPSFDQQALFHEARAWARRHAEPLRSRIRPHTNDPDPERPLRVGYVSPDFRAHAVQQFLVPLLERHDASDCELYLYSSVERPDAETEWYRAFAGERFRDIATLSDTDAAELVRKDRIDVLVDLAVHGAGHRLRVFACKPAPVQFTWLGYAGTTGLDTIDYRITDRYFDPPGTDLGVYSEESIYLPETFWCYDALESDLPLGPLPARKNGTLTFGCLNAPRKLHPNALSLWARVLGELPDSRLFLYVEEPARAATLRTLAEGGVGAERVEFGGRVSRREYLERHQRLDIALDPFPFAGGTTSLDAFWMGVPVVTLSSATTTLQRAGACIALNLGLPELVAHTPDEFFGRAVALARDLERLAALRAELRARLEASPFGDASRFARNLEAAYRTGWRRYCAGRGGLPGSGSAEG